MFLTPLRARRIAHAMDPIARCCPLTQVKREDSSNMSFDDSLCVILPSGILNLLDIRSDMSCSVTSGREFGVTKELEDCLQTDTPAPSSKEMA